jgi:predicted permease
MAGGRSVLRARAFAMTVTLTLGLGIGLATAVLTVANATLLRDLPMSDQDRLVALWGARRDVNADNWPLTLPQAREFAAQARALTDVGYVAYEGAWPVVIRTDDQLTRLRRALVSGNFFDVLGTRAELGRALQTSDNVVGAAPVVVISKHIWLTRYGGSADVIGQSIVLAEFGITARIVGVMPEGLEYPATVDFWAPYVPARLRSEADTNAYTAVTLVARLAPSATRQDAATELTTFVSRPGSSPWMREMRGIAQPLPRVILGDVRPAVLAFTAAAALLLLITCMNVANLLLVRGLGRVREIGVRVALGASRRQIIGELVAENAILALVGGAMGVALAAAAVTGFLALIPADVPLLHTSGIDSSSLLGALGITAIAMLSAGVVPAFASARGDPHVALTSGARVTTHRGGRIVRELLVGAQVCLALLTLSGAALVGRSLLKLQNVDVGFDAPNVLVAELAIPFDRYDGVTEQVAVIRQIVERLDDLPEVDGVSPVVAMPFSGTGGWTGRAGLPGQTPDEVARNPMFNMDVVTPDYFATMGLWVVRGRALNDGDVAGAERVAIVSETMARRYWQVDDPIGKRFMAGTGLRDAITVVGMVRDTRYRDLREPLASVYFPLAQSAFPYAPTTLVIRTVGSPTARVAAMRRAIEETGSGVALANAAPFEAYMDGPLAGPRINAFLLGVFALSAALLAAVGLFSIMATMVKQRTREIGTRMALGATPAMVRGMVLGRGLAIAGRGVAAGMLGAVLTNQLLSSLLYEVSPADIVTLSGVAALLLSVAVLATYVPARASSRIHPSIALRTEA